MRARGLTIVRCVMLLHKVVFTQISGVHLWLGLASIKRGPRIPTIGRNAWVNANLTGVYAECNKSVSEKNNIYTPKRTKKLSFGCVLLDTTRNCRIQTRGTNFKQGSISEIIRERNNHCVHFTHRQQDVQGSHPRPGA